MLSPTFPAATPPDTGSRSTGWRHAAGIVSFTLTGCAAKLSKSTSRLLPCRKANQSLAGMPCAATSPSQRRPSRNMLS